MNPKSVVSKNKEVMGGTPVFVGTRVPVQSLFDYLERELDGREFLIGDRLSIADIAVACQLTNLELVAGLPDKARWPGVVAHTERMRDRASFVPSLTICRKIIKEPVDLS